MSVYLSAFGASGQPHRERRVDVFDGAGPRNNWLLPTRPNCGFHITYALLDCALDLLDS
jgi:hypothetical protein